MHIIVIIPLDLQEDREWEWTKLFAEVSPDIQSVWERRDRDKESREAES